MDPPPKSRDQVKLHAISDGVTMRVERRGQLVADHFCDSRREVDRHRGPVRSLHLGNEFVADPNSARHLAEAQTAPPPGDAELIGDPVS